MNISFIIGYWNHLCSLCASFSVYPTAVRFLSSDVAGTTLCTSQSCEFRWGTPVLDFVYVNTKKNLEQNRFYFLMFVRISIFYCLFQKRSGWLFGRWELVGSNIVNGPFWNIPGGLVSSYRLQIHNTKMNFPTKEEL